MATWAQMLMSVCWNAFECFKLLSPGLTSNSKWHNYPLIKITTNKCLVLEDMILLILSPLLCLRPSNIFEILESYNKDCVSLSVGTTKTQNKSWKSSSFIELKYLINESIYRKNKIYFKIYQWNKKLLKTGLNTWNGNRKVK